MVTNIKSFEEYVNKLWFEALTGDFLTSLTKEDAFKDKRIVGIYLTQVYHYAVHTHRHQALVGVNQNNKNIAYQKYCFEHAVEETGHELMALKDIQSLGYNITEDNMPGRLPSTDLLIAFLYQEAQSNNPIHHLGYGFWSENACPFITAFIDNLMESVGLSKNQLTFYNNHVVIDEDHAKHVRGIINQVAKTQDDWDGMKRVAEISFQLTLGIVKDSLAAYKKLIKNEENEFLLFNKEAQLA